MSLSRLIFRNMTSEQVPPGDGPRDAADAAAPTGAESGQPRREGDGQMELRDPAVMRALAHPLRWALLEALLHAGTLTATQAGEILGETPANCAFHLRTLARYGLVEEAGGGKGRARPWRRVNRVVNLTTAHDDPRAAAAAEVLDEFWITRTLDRANAALRRKRSWPAEWLAQLGESQTIRYITPAEAQEMQELLMAALDRYRDRSADPSLRPPGALPVEYLVLSYPLLDLASRDVPTTPAAEPASAAGQAKDADQDTGPEADSETNQEKELPL
jgi:predicted transcriptional regulator